MIHFIGMLSGIKIYFASFEKGVWMVSYFNRRTGKSVSWYGIVSLWNFHLLPCFHKKFTVSGMPMLNWLFFGIGRQADNLDEQKEYCEQSEENMENN